ncbi:D-lactate dehydrogenase [Xylariales sp. PMI_506]|nr:D-lactate dehydrogenase [Xylariales sp. PMI_506]
MSLSTACRAGRQCLLRALNHPAKGRPVVSSINWPRSGGRAYSDKSGAESSRNWSLPVIFGAGSVLSTLPLAQVPAIKHDVSPKNIAAARAEIAAIVGEDNINDKADEIARHTSTEWSSYAERREDEPHFVVFAESTEQVSQIVRVCHRRRIPIVAFSGGTSLEGHFANVCSGISIDLSRMDKILALHKSDLDIVVQPGVTYTALNEALDRDNLFFPPDPGPGAMIGGMVGTGCSGTNAFYYGTMRDWVTNLTVVLADGTVVKTRQRPRKSSAGYDLTHVFIGSEGTLGIVTEATLKLTSKPVSERVAVASFSNYHDACALVIKLVEAGIKVAAVELVGDSAMSVMNNALDRNFPVSPALFLKFVGDETSVAQQMGVVGKLAQQNKATGIETTSSQDEAADIWEARKQALFMVSGAMAEGERPWITDVAVPIGRLADIVEITAKDIEETGVNGMIVGHVGDGNFHTFLTYSPDQRPIVEALVHRMVERAIEMEGTITGEHGVGLIKRDFLEKEVSKETVDLMRQLKKSFDPLCILNCDKVVRMKQPTNK